MFELWDSKNVLISNNVIFNFYIFNIMIVFIKITNMIWKTCDILSELYVQKISKKNF